MRAFHVKINKSNPLLKVRLNLTAFSKKKNPTLFGTACSKGVAINMVTPSAVALPSLPACHSGPRIWLVRHHLLLQNY
jgi:hypothetical protein